MGWKAWLAAGAVVVGAVAAAPIAVLAWTFIGNPPIVDGRQIAGTTRVIRDGYVASFLVTVGPGRFVLVDAGSDPGGAPIESALAAVGATRDAVEAVLLTHGHPDHTGACSGFPKAKIYAANAELPLLAGRVAARGPLPRLFGASPSGCSGVLGIDDGTVLSVGEGTATMYGIPGHTQGSAAWLVGGVLFLGDAADATPEGEVVPGKWVFSDDVGQARRSLAALAERTRTVQIEALAFSHTGTLPGSLTR